MGKRAKNILFGFNAPNFSNSVVEELKKRGETVNSKVCLSKREIKEFLVGHPEYRHVVLLETLYKEDGSTELFSAEELSKMTDTHNINIIIVLSEKHRGTNYMKTLYAANITSALFQDENKGASEEMVMSLILKRRSRRAARTYYGIDRQPIRYTSVGVDASCVLEQLDNLDFGETLLERFLLLTKGMSCTELVALINSLPAEFKEELCRYEEFYILVDAIKQKGVNIRIKRPKKVEFGLYLSEKDIFSNSQFKSHNGYKEIKSDDIFTGVSEYKEDESSTHNTSINDRTNDIAESVNEQQVRGSDDSYFIQNLSGLSLDDLFESGDEIISKELVTNENGISRVEQTEKSEDNSLVRVEHASEINREIESSKNPNAINMMPENMAYAFEGVRKERNSVEISIEVERDKSVIEELEQYEKMSEDNKSQENSSGFGSRTMSDEEEHINKLIDEIRRRNEDTKDAYNGTFKSKEIGSIDGANVPTKPRYVVKDLSGLI